MNILNFVKSFLFSDSSDSSDSFDSLTRSSRLEVKKECSQCQGARAIEFKCEKCTKYFCKYCANYGDDWELYHIQICKACRSLIEPLANSYKLPLIACDKCGIKGSDNYYINERVPHFFGIDTDSDNNDDDREEVEKDNPKPERTILCTTCELNHRISLYRSLELLNKEYKNLTQP